MNPNQAEQELKTAIERFARRMLEEATQALNQTARRLRGAGSHEEWLHTLTEAASASCAKAAVITITAKGFSLNGSTIPLASAPAVASAVESQDTVVAVGTPGELSETVSAILGDASAKKVYLFPVLARQKVVAVLYAEPDHETPVDVSALELLASLAAVSFQGSSESLIRISGVSAPAPSPKWNDLPLAEQEQHLRAQRFARTKMAELLLHQTRRVRGGRKANNLYGALKEELEAGREAFRKNFVETCPSMVDYFHLELQRTLAQDNASALGPDYPGPLPVGTGSGARQPPG